MKNNGILVIHPYLKSNRMSKDYCLEEAINLIKAIGLDCVESSGVGLEKISSKTFLNIGYIKNGKNGKVTSNNRPMSMEAYKHF